MVMAKLLPKARICNCKRQLRPHLKRLAPRLAASRQPQLAAAESDWRQQAWGFLAVLLSSIHLVLGAPALANTSTFTVTQSPASTKAEEEEFYFETVPQDLSSTDDKDKGPRLGSLIEGPKGKQVQQCTRTCMPACIRGGQGGPGLGPVSVRKEIVVFKEGYRSRSYCLSECTQVCALQINAKGDKEVK